MQILVGGPTAADEEIMGADQQLEVREVTLGAAHQLERLRRVVDRHDENGKA